MILTIKMNTKSIESDNKKDAYVEPGKWVGPPDKNGIRATEEFHKNAFDDSDDSDDEK
jgi:hypothetical protein